MSHALQMITAFAAMLFAGAALYVNVVDHPARMVLETKSAAQQWAPSYKRATLMQAPLALVSLLSGVTAWLLGASIWWLVAALLIGAVVPYTFLVVMPTNHKILEPDRDLSSVETRELLQKWARLHGIRTAFSLVAAGIDVWQLGGASPS
ncbi:DUF1772 domain-containing protein (plasmid) [Cupriavidus necator]|uniref:DUF1772 domain-containing protein n=1 Tax=Cupriavidus necator TaxID=106590 RepID=A0A367PLR4_CUPNE|nr:DUF1772 domain-containing protein [Cupriavidus necator]QQX89163.1 DUF1772 domain-containing protein [Cupriavidus necator]RCJ08464.1 DUF1772 domain-containing protein [Cupriavidus necator]